MKCPICNINHRKVGVAERCDARINNEYCHYIILTYHMPGGLTEENLLKYKHLSIENYRRVKELKERMKTFMEKFKI